MDSLIEAMLLVFVILLVAVIFWRIIRSGVFENDAESKIERKLLAIENALLTKVAKKRNIDADKEVIKQEQNSRNELRNKIYEEMVTEMFPEQKEEEA